MKIEKWAVSQSSVMAKMTLIDANLRSECKTNVSVTLCNFTALVCILLSGLTLL